MSRRHYKLPPFTMLVTFEAAARHGSFKQAALELGVTPGAISHQIRSLETELTATLFHRQYRGVSLTPQGALLAETLQEGFSAISRTLKVLREHDRNRPVTIAATTAISSLWLTPRITAFWRTHGQVSVNQQISDASIDLGTEGLLHTDLRIRYGKPVSSHHCCIPLFRDTLVPVCSPAFAAENPSPDLDTLARLPLIQFDTDEHCRTNWSTWFEELGYTGECEQGARVNNYTIALQLGREGLGVVLGWRALIEPLIERGELVVLGTHAIAAPKHFYIEYESDITLSAHGKLLCDWLSSAGNGESSWDGSSEAS